MKIHVYSTDEDGRLSCSSPLGELNHSIPHCATCKRLHSGLSFVVDDERVLYSIHSIEIEEDGTAVVNCVCVHCENQIFNNCDQCDVVLPP